MPVPTPTPRLTQAFEEAYMQDYFWSKLLPMYGLVLLVLVVIIIIAYLYRHELARMLKRFIDQA